MELSDRRLLIVFLMQLRDQDLPRSIESLEDDLRGFAADAWEELLGSGEFEAVLSDVESGAFDTRLDANGLGGRQLAFKLAVVDRARAQADQADQADEPEPSRGPVRRLLRKLLAGSDVILDSIVDALTGRGEAIKELKEAVGIGLED